MADDAASLEDGDSFAKLLGILDSRFAHGKLAELPDTANLAPASHYMIYTKLRRSWLEPLVAMSAGCKTDSSSGCKFVGAQGIANRATY